MFACLFLHTQFCRYDPISSCLVDFHGRANLASAKNCQLVYSNPISNSSRSDSKDVSGGEMDADHFVLQLGKVNIYIACNKFELVCI